MRIARNGLREIVLTALIFGAAAAVFGWYYWPLSLPFILVWLCVVAFFRDPDRRQNYAEGDLCSPADGVVTEVSELPFHESIDGPAIKIGMFLSLFDVHINRMPCSGRIRRISYKKGEFLDARHPESGQRNESNTLVIDPDPPMPGPVVVRQVAGLVARRIVCGVKTDEHVPIGERIGLIKFGSRTELIIPHRSETEILVRVGDKVRGAVTILARQRVLSTASTSSIRSESARPTLQPASAVR